jgi:hypothetical protein
MIGWPRPEEAATGFFTLDSLGLTHRNSPMVLPELLSGGGFRADPWFRASPARMETFARLQSVAKSGRSEAEYERAFPILH